MQMLRQFRTFGRPVQLLLLNQLVINIGFYMLVPYLSSYLGNTLGFATWMVGLVLGMRTFSQQGLSVIGGTLSDHVGYKPVIAGGCALRMAGFFAPCANALSANPAPSPALRKSRLVIACAADQLIAVRLR